MSKIKLTLNSSHIEYLHLQYMYKSVNVCAHESINIYAYEVGVNVCVCDA